MFSACPSVSRAQGMRSPRAVRFRSYRSRMLSSCVPAMMWSGLTQPGLSQVWRATSPFASLRPSFAAKSRRCSLFVGWPYSSTFPPHGTQAPSDRDAADPDRVAFSERTSRFGVTPAADCSRAVRLGVRVTLRTSLRSTMFPSLTRPR